MCRITNHLFLANNGVLASCHCSELYRRLIANQGSGLKSKTLQLLQPREGTFTVTVSLTLDLPMLP